MNGKCNDETGHALVVVLIFSVLVAMLALVALESSWLQAKMSLNFEEHLHRQRRAESQLRSIEAQLEENFAILPHGVKHRQFVPDTLHFEEQSGVNYFEVENDEISSTFACR